MKRIPWILAGIVALAVLASVPPVALAQSPDTPSDIFIATAYPSIVVTAGDSISFPIKLDNKTKLWQSLELQAQVPEGWTAVFKSGGYTVRQVMVDPEKTETVTLQLTPPQNVTEGTTAVTVKAVAPDGSVNKELRLAVTINPKQTKRGLKLDTKFPNLRGSATNTFSFKLDLKNESDQDRTVNVTATAPEGWQVTFKPTYESKQVQSFSLKANATQGIDVDVTPLRRAEPGEYQIVVHASADGDETEFPLTVVIAGQPSLSLTTLSGNLATKASSDTETKVSLVIENTGSVPLENITFSSSKPDGWEVKFNPERVEQLPVGQTADVTVSLKPSARALAGDYLVELTAMGSSVSDSKDLRVTVETPTTWGWAAVGAILLIVVGLAAVFMRFSRR